MQLALVSVPAYLSSTWFRGVWDVPVGVEVVYGDTGGHCCIGLGWARGEQCGWIAPELWDCLLYTPNFQHTLNFISHRGLG